MININRNNYEKYFLDFIDGELSASNEKLLMLFLNENPDLREELELFENDSITIDKINYENKISIKRSEILSDLTLNNFDELCISRIEGDLNINETIEFDRVINDYPKRKKEYDLYKLTKIAPEKNEVFKNKNKLKKKEGKVIVLSNKNTVISIAASVIILIALYIFIPKENNNKELISELDKKIKVERSLNSNKNEKKERVIKNRSIKPLKAVKNKITTKQKIEIKFTDNSDKNEITLRNVEQIAYINPMEIEIDYAKNIEILYVILEKDLKKDNIPEKYISLKSYLAETFNKKILKNKKNKIELFDIAQASVKGINKLTGSRMSLERSYDKSGNPEKTEFNSRLLAFSTPSNK